MSTSEITDTYLGTGNTPLSICDDGSIPYFPALGALDYGLNMSGSLFDTSCTASVFELDASVEYKMFVGICGPSGAIGMDMNATISDGGTGTLTISNDEMQAGFFCGANLTVAVAVSVKTFSITVTWNKWGCHIQTTWSTLLAIDLSVTLDLFSLLIQAIKAATSEEPLDAETSPPARPSLDGLTSLWGAVGTADKLFSAGSAKGGPTTTGACTPSIPLTVNIISYIPAFAPVIQSLDKVSVDVTLGPTLKLGFPLSVTLSSLTVSTLSGLTTGTYNIKAGSSAGSFNLSGGPTNAISQLGLNNGKVAINFTYTPQISLSFGVTFEFSLLGMVNLGGTFTLPFSFGVSIAGATSSSISNTIGQSKVAALPGCGACGEEVGELMNVVFEAV